MFFFLAKRLFQWKHQKIEISLKFCPIWLEKNFVRKMLHNFLQIKLLFCASGQVGIIQEVKKLNSLKTLKLSG